MDLHRGDASPDPNLITLLRFGLSGRLDIRVSEVAEEEIAGAKDAATRALGLDRLRMFPVLKLPPHRVLEAEALTASLRATLFPKSKQTSRTTEHNDRDCRHLAIHKIMGRAAFVTLDDRLRKRNRISEREFGIRIQTPAELVYELVNKQPALTKIEATVAAKPFDAEDEAEVRRVLGVLSADYPDFDGWLTRTLADPDTTIVVGLLDGRVAGAVIWKARGSDNRAVKLSAFRIDDTARNSGLGGHMLFHALRQWVSAGYEVAYVTVSSAHSDLITFFSAVGFLIQGVSPLRYHDDATEIVMGKLILKLKLTPDNLQSFADHLGQLVFGRPGGADGGPGLDDLWFLPPRVRYPMVEVDPNVGSLRFVDEVTHESIKVLSAFELETTFHPLRVAVPGRRALLVPIQPGWADRMITYVGRQEALFAPRSDPLLIRSDNAYYCFPRCAAEVEQNCRILFYVSAPISAIVGEAIITRAVVDYPEVLHQLFGDLGIYSLSQIRQHTTKRGARAGMALALRFAFYVPFQQPVSLLQLRLAAKSPRFTPQGLHPIDIETYEALRSSGGLNW